MKYLIEATVVKNGGEPIYVLRYSDKEISKCEFLRMLTRPERIQIKYPEQDYYFSDARNSLLKEKLINDIEIRSFNCKAV